MTTPETAQEATQETTPEQICSRRLVIVTGDKGGVGKSTFARGLLQVYLDEKKDFIAFDADMSNPQIRRFYGSECTIEPLNIFKRGEIDTNFMEQLGKYIEPPEKEDKEGGEIEFIPKPLFLLELPPQSSNILKDFLKRMKFLETIKNAYDMRVTMVVVISRTIDSVNQFVDLYNSYENHVDYVVVKNYFFGEEGDFRRYNNSPALKEIKNDAKKSKYIREISMPDLIEHAYDYLDENSLTFAQGIEQNKRIAVKGRVGAWMDEFNESIKSVKHLLGV
ncbi:hypothetical protein [Nostoc sp. CCY0012]|uniref:nucleotide-binding protein n=1 Tax=Nostoc sp. CCY0012 TaxID=1056123 RepID=UPI0039C5ACB8